MSQKQAVQVYIRTRPTDQFASNALQINPANGEFTIKVDKKDEGVINNCLDNWKFKFDNIMLNTTQDDVYDMTAAQTVQNVVAGYNGTIMAYGQTGSGKTFTMLGLSNNFKQRGIIPRAIQQIFHATSQKFDQSVTIRVSYVEIYNDKMLDLLAPPEEIGSKRPDLSIQDDSRGGVAVKNLHMEVCDNEEDALNMLFEGETNRSYAAHEMNSHSSRSHAVYTVHIESRSKVESHEKIVFSKLHLVDLAGSERTKKTGTKGSQLVEARHINKSLSYLEQVVLALSDKKRDHVPYRQTTLTNFLRDSLGGNCKTVVISNVHCVKSHLEETISTLKFSTRMMKVKNLAVVNSVVDPAIAIKRYEKEIRDLKQELAMHDTLSNRGRINYDQYSPEELKSIRAATTSFLQGETDDIATIDSLRMIREIFGFIKTEYKKSNQHIESLRRQMEENPEKFKQVKKEEEIKAEEEAKKAQEEAAKMKEDSKQEGSPEDNEDAEKEEQPVVEEPKKKREACDKQVAYIEFKGSEGKKVENSIIESRNDMKEKRIDVKDVTTKINYTKQEIDRLQSRLDKKEEERRLQSRAIRNDIAMDAFDDDDVPQDEIIDEEELIMLKEMKDLKREYRDNFSKLKGLKSDITNLQNNINQAKESMIMLFENWYAEEFETLPFDQQNPTINLQQDDTQVLSQNQDATPQSKGDHVDPNIDQNEDEDAAIYRRAKFSVDELHRARKFQKSIKLR